MEVKEILRKCDHTLLSQTATWAEIKAICDDGKLDIVIIDGIKKRMIPGALIKLLKSKILEQKYTIHTLAPELKAKFSRPTTIQIDGELYDDLPFDVRIVHDQLRVYR